jgi:hypothetical protein
MCNWSKSFLLGCNSCLLAWPHHLPPFIIHALNPTCAAIHLDSPSSEVQREALHEATHKRWARLIEYAAERYPDNNKFLVYYLVAAPLDWRDAELGLQIARSAYEKKNCNQTRQCLVWAFFGAGRWEECLSIIENMNSSKDGHVELEVRAIQAMALWHLGERQKARQCLEGDYEQELAEFVQRWEESIKEKRSLSLKAA